MDKTTKVNLNKLKFRQVDLVAQIEALEQPTAKEYLDELLHQWRPQRIAELKVELASVSAQIAFLEKEAAATSVRPAKVFKKVEIHSEVLKRQAQSPGMKLDEIFNELADERDDTYAATKKAYYDHEKDLKEKRKRKSDAAGKAQKQSPEKSRDS